MRTGGVPIRDEDLGQDNVEHTNMEFCMLDAVGALDSLRKHLERRLYLQGKALR